MRKLDVSIEDLQGEEARQVAEAAAPTTQPDTRERLEDVILSHGFSPPEKLLDQLEDVMEDTILTQAATVLRHLLQSLKGRTLTEAVRGVVLGRDESLRAVAKRARVSHVGLMKAERTVRAVIKKLPADTIGKGPSKAKTKAIKK
jgi:hypothetical protein